MENSIIVFNGREGFFFLFVCLVFFFFLLFLSVTSQHTQPDITGVQSDIFNFFFKLLENLVSQERSCFFFYFFIFLFFFTAAKGSVWKVL